MRYLLIILIIFTYKGNTYAGVDLRHGIFYMSYTDIDFTSTKADITRSYSSTSTDTGMFGYGWSTLLESSITAFPDGTLTLSWSGGGLGDYYEPAVINRKGLYEMLNSIITDLIRNKKLNNDPVAIAEKKSYYIINNKERAKKYIELQKAKLVPMFIPAGGQQKWLLDVNQVIVWTGKFFKVTNWEDEYHFNPRGQLVLLNDRSYKMELKYLNDQLSSIIVNDTNACQVTTDAKGRIIRLALPLDNEIKTAIFRYDSSSNLIYSKDAGDNEYWFSYDLYHNLVRIGYVDSTSLEVTYDAATNRVTRLKDPKGNYTMYQYPYFYTSEGKINYDHYATNVKQFDSKGKLLFTQYKEFENRVKDDGSTYLHRILERSDTSYHEVLYEAEVGNARYRKKNNKEAWAAYDSKDRPAYLHINDSIYKSSYNVLDLPAYFLAKDSLSGDSVYYQYRYGSDGRLLEVVKNENRFQLLYNDKEGLIKIITDEGDSFSIIKPTDSIIILNDNNWGSVELTAKEWNDINDSLPATHSSSTGKQKQINDAENSDSGARRSTKDMVEERRKQKELATKQKTDDKKKNSTRKDASPPVLSTEEKKKKLISVYYDFRDILKAQKIAHEWIWERM